MSDELYRLIFDGRVLEGNDREIVQKRLSSLLKIEAHPGY